MQSVTAPLAPSFDLDAARRYFPRVVAAAELFHASKLFARKEGPKGDRRLVNPSVAVLATKILMGRALGLSEFQSVGINVIEGNVTVSARLASHLFLRPTLADGRPNPCGYRVTRLDYEACEIEVTRGGEVVFVSTYTYADAEQAGLAGRNENYQKHPRSMLFARAITNALLWAAGDLLGGVSAIVDDTPDALDSALPAVSALVEADVAGEDAAPDDEGDDEDDAPAPPAAPSAPRPAPARPPDLGARVPAAPRPPPRPPRAAPAPEAPPPIDLASLQSPATDDELAAILGESLADVARAVAACGLDDPLPDGAGAWRRLQGLAVGRLGDSAAALAAWARAGVGPAPEQLTARQARAFALLVPPLDAVGPAAT